VPIWERKKPGVSLDFWGNLHDFKEYISIGKRPFCRPVLYNVKKP
jgi:hypothetical protein